MSTHWTYCTPEPSSNLQQGDIVGRSDSLLQILRNVHAYFCDERYTAFLVVTQSCDLVQRKRGECKARHISLAVIRELDQVLPNIIQELSGSQYQSILISEKRVIAEEFMERVIDQNEQSRGLFYLHPSADAGIAVASLAFLRITITLRHEHYELLRQCRVGRIEPEFANKLGWLVGNLYSRIGTPDWNDMAGNNSGRSLAKRYLAESAPESKWVPETWLRQAEKSQENLDTLEGEPAVELARFAPPTPLEIVLNEVHSNAMAIKLGSISKQLEEILKSDQVFISSVADDIIHRLDSMVADDQIEGIRKTLQEDTRFIDAAALAIKSLVGKPKNVNCDDPVNESLLLARSSNTAIPPLKQSIIEVLAEIGVELPSASQWLESSPFFSQNTIDRVSALIADLGHAEWINELSLLKRRLMNSSKLKSVVG